MISSHIAHDCKIGNNVIIANNVAIAGHVEIDDNVIVLNDEFTLARYTLSHDVDVICVGEASAQDIPKRCD